jgi:putative DNA primase/helicase
MHTADYPVWLAILPDQRDEARAAAGKHPDGRSAITWSKEEQLWYARPGADLSRVKAWLPDKTIRSTGGGDPQSEFFDELTRGGLVLDGLPVMDGKRHRVPVVEGKKGNVDGVYRGFLDGIKPAGWYINYHRAEDDRDITRWKASGREGEADPTERVHIRAIMRQAKDDFESEQAALYARQSASAKALHARLPAADPDHGYLTRKGVTAATDVRQTRNGALIVPFYDVDGEFRTLQYIPPDGGKYLFKDAPKLGHFRVEGGELKNGDPILYAEGYATARSLHMVTQRSVVMTIDAGNMMAVAEVLKARYPDSSHLFMADVDHAKEINKGVLAASRAAEMTGGVAILPDLTSSEIEQGFTDFNDLHQSRGLERLRDTLLPEIARALEGLHVKETPMATPDDVPAAPDSHSAPTSDYFAETPTTSDVPETPRSRPGTAKEKQADILALRDEGLKAAQIAERLGIGQSSVYRILRAQEAESKTSEQLVADAAPRTAEPAAPLTSPSQAVPAVASTQAGAEDMAARVAALSTSGMSLPGIAAELNLGMGETYRLIQQTKADSATDAPREPDPDFKAAFADIGERLQSLLNAADKLSQDELLTRLSVLMAERKQLTGIWLSSDDAGVSDVPDSACLALESQLQGRLAPPESVPAAPDATTATPLTAPSGEENAILTGSRRIAPTDEDAPEARERKRIDTDKLLSRVTHETQPDGKSVLYKLDGEPAFFDRGNRLVMAEGASTHEEKVLAALLTASEHYHGRIELTGSDAFKAFAINVIVTNKLDVSMKNASQQAALDDARRAAGLPVAPADTVRGEPPVQRAETAPAAAAGNAPLADVPEAGNKPAPVIPTNTVPVNFDVTMSPNIEVAKAPAKPEIPPAVHTPAEKASEPVTGKVTACGEAPFRFDPEESNSTFITLRTREGSQTFWGKELAGLLRETRLKEGQMVTLQWMGEQRVTINKPVKNTQGEFTGHYEKVDTKRNQWSLTPVRGARVQTGGDEMVTLAALEANRYTKIQHAVVSRLGIDMPAPPKPADGLYWLRPDGQGSTTPGDALSAERPAHNERAGTAVMSSWGADGTLDLYLVQGDGHYLQGIVRQNGVYQHALVTLPDSKDAPRMVINLLTPEGAVPVGSGNAINRSNGQSIAREHVVIRMTGEEQPRIAKLDAPAEVPPALHARLGYDERYRAETTYSKDRPAAAPQAAPVTPPRPA